jgi:hypothetical protein
VELATIWSDPENEVSARVAEKAGMGLWKETVRPTGKQMLVYRRMRSASSTA